MAKHTQIINKGRPNSGEFFILNNGEIANKAHYYNKQNTAKWQHTLNQI
jgi:hypothetical protein